MATAVAWVRRNPGVTLGATVLAAMLLVALLVPLPYDPIAPSSNILRPPSADHLFGTDRSGFDVFSRTVASAAHDLPLSLAGTGVSVVVGVAFGLLASGNGRSSTLIMRALDAFQAFPLLILAIVLVTLSGNRLENVVLAIAVINVPRFMRLVRSEVQPMLRSRFIEAARALGATPSRVLFRHVLPNVTPIIVVQCALSAAHAIGVVAALSFLGIGVSPPEATWGSMIQAGAPLMTTGQWWVVAFPGLAIFVAVLCLNLIGDGLSDASHRVER